MTTIDNTLDSVSGTGASITACNTAHTNLVNGIAQIPTGTATQQMPTITYTAFMTSAGTTSIAPAAIGKSDDSTTIIGGAIVAMNEVQDSINTITDDVDTFQGQIATFTASVDDVRTTIDDLATTL